MKGRRWFEVRSAALLIGPLNLDVFIKPFELEPITWFQSKGLLPGFDQLVIRDRYRCFVFIGQFRFGRT